MTHPLRLFGFDCPFVERSRLLLDLKGVDYEYVSLRFQTAPDWFRELNPMGKVPVLVHEGRAIFESSVINEYIDECFPEPAALPPAAFARAQARILINYCDKSFIAGMFRLLMNRDGEVAEARLAESLEHWQWLEKFLARIEAPDDGPFPFGGFGLTEIAFAPFFRRYQSVEFYRHFELPAGDDFARVRAWSRATLAHPALDGVVLTREDVIKLYFTHSQGWGGGRFPAKGAFNSMDPTIPYADRPMPPRPSQEYWTDPPLETAL